MISKLIKNEDDSKLMAFTECLKETGIYKRKEEEYGNSENLVVICTKPFEIYFGIYDNGDVFPHSDSSHDPAKKYKRIGDIELIVKVMGEK